VCVTLFLKKSWNVAKCSIQLQIIAKAEMIILVENILRSHIIDKDDVFNFIKKPPLIYTLLICWFVLECFSQQGHGLSF
jgi:hypothetical protein